MTDFFRVFCRADQLRASDITSFLSHGASFGPTTITVDPPDSAIPDSWKSITLRYDVLRRPIVIWNGPADILSEELTEAEARLNELGPKSRALIKQHLRETRHVYAIEVSTDSLTDDAWELLDAAEAFLARSCDGIVLAPDEGFFSADLQPLS